MKRILEKLENNPVIPALKEETDIELVVNNHAELVFVLFGDLVSIADIVAKLKQAGKTVFVNVDLISGFSSKDVVADFMKQHTQADGIISAKASLLRHAKEIGFYTVHRFFLIDSFSYHSIGKQMEISKADMLNVLPGWPKVVSWVCEETTKPVIAAGMVCDRKSVNDCLSAGAISICSTNHSVWEM